MSTQDNEGKAIGYLESMSTYLRELLDLAKTPRKGDPPADPPPSSRARKVKDDGPGDPAEPVQSSDPPQPPPAPADPPPNPEPRKGFLVRLLGG